MALICGGTTATAVAVAVAAAAAAVAPSTVDPPLEREGAAGGGEAEGEKGSPLSFTGVLLLLSPAAPAPVTAAAIR